MIRVSDHFMLGRTQPYLDFVDVPLDTDLEVFVNPVAIRSLASAWGSECVSLLQSFFETVLKKIQEGDNEGGVGLLSSLSERNEFHLGYSTGVSRGHAFGSKSGENLWDALLESKAAKSGLLTDLEDACLMVPGIGPDMISDAVCNILRGPLVHYTQRMAEFYGIPLIPDVDSGPLWNPVKDSWERSLVPLPITSFGKLLLVPKIIVRTGVGYSVDEYYRHHLLPVMKKRELQANTALVETLKDGRKRVTKKALMNKYGAGKLAVVEQTEKFPNVLAEYKEQKQARPPKPLSHSDFAEIENTERPNWLGLLEDLRGVQFGRDGAARYEEVIEKLLTAVFYPALTNPTKQHKIHDGRKRIDITYVNEDRVGFFAWLAQHYPASHIFVECKNYGTEVGNPELDQLSGRFSPSRGRVGFLICRSILDKELLKKRCVDTAADDRGFIVALDDEDLTTLVHETLEVQRPLAFPLLKREFNKLIM